jgi:hypothetical protein
MRTVALLDLTAEIAGDRRAQSHSAIFVHSAVNAYWAPFDLTAEIAETAEQHNNSAISVHSAVNSYWALFNLTAEIEETAEQQNNSAISVHSAVNSYGSPVRSNRGDRQRPQSNESLRDLCALRG